MVEGHAGAFGEFVEELMGLVQRVVDAVGFAGGALHVGFVELQAVHFAGRREDAGFRLNAIENTPIKFYDKIMLGLPGRDEQIENMQHTIRNMGRAGRDCKARAIPPRVNCL